MRCEEGRPEKLTARVDRRHQQGQRQLWRRAELSEPVPRRWPPAFYSDFDAFERPADRADQGQLLRVHAVRQPDQRTHCIHGARRVPHHERQEPCPTHQNGPGE